MLLMMELLQQRLFLCSCSLLCLCPAPSFEPFLPRMANASGSPSRSPQQQLAPSAVEERFGILIERSLSEARFAELGIRSWPKWGCPPSKFPWTYDASQTCYLVKGKVKVYPEGKSEFVELGAGDLAVLPKGISCVWDVSVALDKHYKFDH